MKLSYNWLKEITRTKISPEKMAELLNLQVAAVEKIEKLTKDLDQVVVAEILEIKKHPQADKLQLVKVATKQFSNKAIEQFNIVCGAFNIKIGDKVPLALPGVKLPNGLEIKKSVIRGIKSEGMLCAEDELGVGDDHLGILILDKSVKVGEKISKVLDLDDTIIEIENVALTHRPDLFGHFGFAREVAALTNASFKSEILNLKSKVQEPTNIFLNIKVENPSDCPRYMGVVIDNLKISPSPAWLQNRLRNLGIRPINNIVDITNYVLLETGQPLHAFDFEKISGMQIRNSKPKIRNKSKIKNSKQIIIRKAGEGEKLLCLDGIERKLDQEVLVIADVKKPIALAGVVGGEYSGVTEQTKTIVLESANFDPVVIRKGAKKIGLRTEANLRFEKGLPLIFAEQGICRAVELIQEIANGKVVSQIYDLKSKEVEKKLKTKKVINVETEKISDLIGAKISEKQIIKSLNVLGFATKKLGKTLRIVVPAHRNDIDYPEDIIEEIARIYGYQKIKPQPIKAELNIVAPDSLLKLERNLKNILLGSGFDEIYNYSFYGESLINLLKLHNEDHLELANPLNPDQRYLRISLLPKLLENAIKNISYFEKFRIFEIGKIYRTQINTEEGADKRWNSQRQSVRRLADQRKSALLVEQPKHAAGLILEKNKNIFFVIKGVMEKILEKIGIDANRISFQAEKSPNYQYLKNSTGVLIDGKPLAVFGELSDIFRNSLKILSEVGVFEINLEAIKDLKIPDKIFQKISSYPPIIRDLAFLVPRNIVFSDLYQAIKKFHSLICSIEPFDVFESEKLGKDIKNIAFRIIFQSFDRTLKSEEVDKIINELVKNLEQKFGTRFRTF